MRLKLCKVPMMKRNPAILLALSVYSVAPSVAALGLGDIELRSYLNEPLQARIRLRSWQPSELEDLRVSLASREHFERAGMERVPGLSELKFSVVESSDGLAYIELSTRSDFREPFLNFLVEVSWPQGRVLREYTLLLDPPLYGAALAGALQRPVTTRAGETAPQRAGVSSQVATDAVRASRDQSSGGAKGQARQAAALDAFPSFDPAPVEESDKALTYGPTVSGDTLWEVARTIAPDFSADTNQLMLALFRTNPDAFLDQNMNLLKKGVILQIPDEATVLAAQTGEALAEVRRHRALWETYRQAVAARTDSRPAGALAGSNTPPGQTAEVGGSGERIRLLSAGAASSGLADGAEGGGEAEGLRNELALALEDAEASKRENQDLQERLGATETIIEDLRRLVALKDDAISSLQQHLAPTHGQGVEQGSAAAPEAQESPASDTGAAQRLAAAEAVVGAPVEPATDGASEAGEPERATVTEQVPGVRGGMGTAQAAEAVSSGAPASAAAAEEQVEPGVANRSVAVGLGLFGSLLVAISGWVMWRRRRAKADSPSSVDGSLSEEGAAPVGVAEPEAIEAEDVEQGAAAEAAAPAAAVYDPVKQRAPRSALEAAVIDDDPLAEVNVYLAYERFEQAEELVKEAIEKHPDRQEYKLKLLEIFAASKNIAAFEAQALALRQAVGSEHPLVDKALAWWRELAPGRELFAEQLAPPDVPGAEDTGELPADAQFDMSSELKAGAQPPIGSDTFDLPASEIIPDDLKSKDLDFDLGVGPSDAATAGDPLEGTLDFDLSSGEGTVDFDLGWGQGVGGEAQPPAHTLDFSLEEPATAGWQPAQATGLDLDLGADAKAPEPSHRHEGTLDFDLSGFELTESSSSSRVDDSQSWGTDETIDLDHSFGELSIGKPAVESSRQALFLGKDEGTIDFDLGFSDEVEASASNPMQVDSLASDAGFVWEARSTESDVAQDPVNDPSTMEPEADTADLRALAMEEGDAGELEASEAASEPWPDDPITEAEVALEGNLESEPAATAEPGNRIEDQSVERDAMMEGMTAVEAPQISSAQNETLLDAWAEQESDDSHSEADSSLVLGQESLSQDLDQVQTKLDLAQAYLDMGDAEGARSILDEVLSEGDSQQKQVARELLEKLA